ncbi:MAG TPA: urease accessory protein UreE [Stellaceae bacterium]|nr:urease accessory protein UreE [Stellaceae bacterium]
MLRVLKTERAGRWPRQKSRGTVTLDYDSRYRRRLKLTSDQGKDFLLDLPAATALGDGDGLELSDGNWLEVRAAAEALLEVRAQTPELLCRIAWHIGNRHLAAAIEEDRILIRDDHVIAEMLAGLGATLRRIHATFSPEGGAYAVQASGRHDHHDHAHGHDH